MKPFKVSQIQMKNAIENGCRQKKIKIVDPYKHKKIEPKTYLTLTEIVQDGISNIGKNKKETEYNKWLNLRKGKKNIIMANREYNSKETWEEIKTSFDKLSPEDRAFVALYNSDYKDIKLGISTYLDEIACWLICYGTRDNLYKKYGDYVTIIKSFTTDKDGNSVFTYTAYDNDNRDLCTYPTLDEVDNFFKDKYAFRKGNFMFKDAVSYSEVKRLAKAVLKKKSVVEAIQELTKEAIPDIESKQREVFARMEYEYKTATSQNNRIELLKLYSKLLGMESLTINNKNEHTIKGLQVAIASGEIFGLDEDTDNDFVKVE